MAKSDKPYLSPEANKAYRWLLRNTDQTKSDLDGMYEKELLDMYAILKEV